MNKIKYIKLILILTISFFVCNLNGQNLYGRLKIKTSKQNLYWHNIEIIGKDKTIDTWVNTYMNCKIIDSIPQGQYIVRVHSVFYDSIEQKVTINKRTTSKINFNKYYQYDTSSILFLDRMTNIDTLRIYFDENGCFSGSTDYLYIIKQGQIFTLTFKTKSGLNNILLTDKEVEYIKQLEKNTRANKKILLLQQHQHGISLN